MIEKNKLFSIIVPVYNVEEYLAQCLQSLLHQTFEDYDIVVVDDRSKDDSLKIAQSYARRYPDKIRLIEHAVNKGLGGARNTGIQESTGDYLLFIDSDDYLKLDALEKISAVVRESNGDIVEFCFEFVDESGRYLRQNRCRESVFAESGRERSLLTRTVSATNKAIRASLFRDTQILFPEKRYYEDYWTIPKLLMGGCKVVSLNEPLYCYRQRMTSIIHDTNIEKANDIMLGTDELLRYYREHQFQEDLLEELELLAIRNVLYHTTLRVNGIDRRSGMQNRLKNYMQTNFPHFQENPWLELFSEKERKLLKLIVQERYRQLYLEYHGVNRLKGAVKRFLHRVGAESLIRSISGRG